jgi:hypothetical protein
MKANENLVDSQYQVALLFESPAQAKGVSEALRDLGIYAHFYSELDEFWVHINTQTPDFAIVDVRKMSQGTLLLKNHPKAISGDLAFAFYYDKNTEFLTQSTFQYFHYGFIKSELDIRGQVQSILKRHNQELHLRDENNTLKERVNRLQLRSQRLVEDNEIAFNFNTQLKKLNGLVDRMGRINTEKQFYSQLMTVFSEWSDINEFGIYHLGHSGQKLVSPKAIRNKYKELPDLWLTKASGQGIDQFAQEMGHEVAFDLFDKNLRAVNIKAGYDNPEIMILASVDEDNLHQFDWELFEERLSHQFMKFKLRHDEQEDVSEAEIKVWDGLSYLDDIHFHQAQAKHKCVEIDLSSLVNVIKDKHGNRFYWKSFFQDFLGQLDEILSGDYKFTHFGVQSVMVLIDQRYLEDDFNRCKNLIVNFQYWRYFEDTAMMMNASMYPKLKIIAPSSVSYLRQISFEQNHANKIPLETKLTRMDFKTNQLDV